MAAAAGAAAGSGAGGAEAEAEEGDLSSESAGRFITSAMGREGGNPQGVKP